MKEISNELYSKLLYLGIINEDINADIRNNNVGTSDYSKHTIQPWSIWLDWSLNPFDADIIKRVLRTKQGTTRKEDYEKIIHICKECIRQIESSTLAEISNIDFENVK